MSFICLFFPTIISLRNIEFNNYKEFILKYSINNVIINILVLTITFLITHNNVIVDSNLFTIRFSIFYLITSLFIALIVEPFKLFLSKNFKVKVESRK